MNLRITPLLFGLLLGILWLFGLVAVYKKGHADKSLLLPTAQGTDVKIDAVTIEKKAKDKSGAEQVSFVRENEQWYAVQAGLKVRVENFKIDDLVRELTGAKRYEEERTQNDTGAYGLPPAPSRASPSRSRARCASGRRNGSSTSATPAPATSRCTSTRRINRAARIPCSARRLTTSSSRMLPTCGPSGCSTPSKRWSRTWT